MNTSASQPPQNRSQLITIFAWINIVLGILSVIVGLGLMLLFKAVIPTDEILATLQRPEMQQAIPSAMVFALRHMQAILAAFLALSVVTIIASHALLKRRNWARLFWIALMALLVVWFISGLFYQPDITSYLPQELKNAPSEVQAQLNAMIASMRIWGYVLSIVQAAVFSWAVWRFCSADIRSEFQAD